MSGMRMGMDIAQRPDQKHDPGTADDPVHGNPATPDRRSSGQDRTGTAGESVPGAEGKPRRTGRDATRVQPRRARSSTTRPATWSSAGSRSSTATGTITSTRNTASAAAALEEEGDRKLDAMANMPDRPQSLQDYLADQLGEMELEPRATPARPAHLHVHRSHRLPRHRGEKAPARTSDPRQFRTVPLEEIAVALRRAGHARGGRGRHSSSRPETRPGRRRRPRPHAECLLLQISPDTPLRRRPARPDPRSPRRRRLQPHPGDSEGDQVRHPHHPGRDRRSSTTSTPSRG